MNDSVIYNILLVIGKTDEGSSFQYTADKAEEIERRLIPLIKKDGESYKRIIIIFILNF